MALSAEFELIGSLFFPYHLAEVKKVESENARFSE